ncbi:MAG: sensor histidine kinase [Actinomycetota bacterium]|nr:sensor histidine kinase [Actinomycetota bacterium]
MNELGPLQRLPTESRRPMVVFALARLGLTVTALLLVAALGFPYGTAVAAVLGGVALPWSLLGLYLARSRPDTALNPLVALGDMATLAVIELVAPEAYGAVRFLALTLLAVHAHFQGERIGIAVATIAVVALVGPSLVREPVEDAVRAERLLLYEAAFVVAALLTVSLIGRFRTAESASRLRARELTRRTLRSENEIRRKLSEALHDGPVQDLIGLNMTLAAADAAVKEDDRSQLEELIHEARVITERNVRGLRDEMLDLGPYAYDEISYEAAVERCLPVWERRFEISSRLEIEPLELASELEGELFRITQEAVANAARHGEADTVTISLTGKDGMVVMTVADDGKGFRDVDPLGPTEPGHIGLASMRERAELMRGRLEIESTDRGSTVTVSVPISRRRRGLRRPSSRSSHGRST